MGPNPKAYSHFLFYSTSKQNLLWSIKCSRHCLSCFCCCSLHLYIILTHWIFLFHQDLYFLGSSVLQSSDAFILYTPSRDACIQVYNFKYCLDTENSKFMYLTKTLSLNVRLQFPNDDLTSLFKFHIGTSNVTVSVFCNLFT